MTMDHAAAHEELVDLALEPHRLARLETGGTPATAALRAHLAACPDCRTELRAWRRVHAAVEMVTEEAGTPLRSIEPVEPPGAPAGLRARTLAAVADAEAGRVRVAGVAGPAVRRGTAPPRGIGARLGGPSVSVARLGRLGWLAAAAALVVAIGLGGLLVQRAGEADQARRESADLATAAATLDRILATPTHWVVTLRTADGAPGGTLAWSASDVVVLTSALPPATPGMTYRCWIERAGTRTPVGVMSFSGLVGYWAGSAASWGSLGPGSRFGVTAISGADSGGPAMLVADL